jgi:hypothetical protein
MLQEEKKLQPHRQRLRLRQLKKLLSRRMLNNYVDAKEN